MSRYKRSPENKGLPTRWQHKHGAYYYRVPPGCEASWNNQKIFRLGKKLSEAYRFWADRVGTIERVPTINKLLERYAAEVIPTKAPKTQSDNTRYLTPLRKAFGSAPLVSIRPQHIYQYVDKRSSRILAHREIALLSHALTKAVEWGEIDRHPFKGEVRLASEAPRTRYVEDWEIVECLSLQPVQGSGGVLAIQSYIRLKLIIGLRRGDLLRLRTTDFKDDGIHVTTNKRKKATIYTWTPLLRQLVDEALAARPVDISPFVFCTRRGEGYINEKTGEAHGWNSMWQRFMGRVLSETKVKESFTEHDLRAKCASDAETLEHAKALLTHSSSSLTQKVYRRKAERVAPLNRIFMIQTAANDTPNSFAQGNPLILARPDGLEPSTP